LEVHILEVGILLVDILEVDILLVDILEVDIEAAPNRCVKKCESDKRSLLAHLEVTDRASAASRQIGPHFILILSINGLSPKGKRKLFCGVFRGSEMIDSPPS
jgi:hypothetical protein